MSISGRDKTWIDHWPMYFFVRRYENSWRRFFQCKQLTSEFNIGVSCWQLVVFLGEDCLFFISSLILNSFFTTIKLCLLKVSHIIYIILNVEIRFIISFCVHNSWLWFLSCYRRRRFLKPISQLRFDYDTTIPRRIRRRRKWSKLRFAFDSTAIWFDLYLIWYNNDSTTTKNWHVHFLLASNRARYVVVGS